MLKKLYNITEVGKLFGQSDSTTYRWVSEGRIPYIKIRRKILFLETDIKKLIQKSRISSKVEIGIEVDEYLYNLKRK